MSKARHQLILIFYLCFVAYGSLVPLNFVPLTLDAAGDRFLNIPWLRLSAVSRADWVANILLYMPLAFLLVSRLSRSGARAVPVDVAITLFFCITVAIGIEYLQVFFPPRTVSLNDLFAEFIGIALGITMWLTFGSSLARLGKSFCRGDSSAFDSLLWIYLLIYLLISLFPFDFVVSLPELQAKLLSETTGMLFARGGCDGVFSCAAKTIVEGLLTVPIGLLLASQARGQRRSYLLPFTAGIIFGLLIELVQVLIVSGISQGFSAIPKSLGVVVGYSIYATGNTPLKFIVHANSKALVAVLSIPYLMSLLVANNWFRADWVTSVEAAKNLSEVNFLPFYYHYYTTETVAMASLLFNGFLYSPIGFAASFIQKGARKPSYVFTAIVAASLALLIEGARLFQSGMHADPTNIIIAIASAMLAQLIGLKVWSLAKGAGREMECKPEVGGATRPSKHAFDLRALFKKTPFWRAVIGLVLIGISAFSLYMMPVATPFLMVVAGTLLFAQYVFPSAWLYVLPSIVTVLDITPWSGWFFWDEADAFLMLLLGGLLITNAPTGFVRSKGSRVMIALLCLSWASAALVPILPLPAIDMNSFNNYFSSFNSLRVGKGFLWALIFMPFFAIVATDMNARIALLRGVLVGAGLLAGWVVVERQLFSGILDLGNDFRVTASLSTMHTGGGHIEAMLVVLFPLVVHWLIAEKSRWKLLLGPVVLLALGYSLLVTYARAGYGAFLVSMILMGLFLGVRARKRELLHRVASPLFLALVGSAVFVLLLVQSSYVQQRMGSTGQDMKTRLNHWSSALEMMDRNLSARLFGMGLGQYPLTYAYRNPAGVTLSSYRFSGAEANPYLDVGAGQTLYYEQIIAIRPNTIYTFSVDLKSNVDRGQITTPICEKAMLYSYHCEWISLSYERSGSDWQTLRHTFNSGKLGGGDILNSRPVKFSFYNPTQNSILSVDNISIKGADGHNLIQNGAFSKTNDHWFFSTDNHLPWHTKQLGVQLYFSQGLVGVVIFLTFLLLTLSRLLKGAISGDVFSVALISSTTAFILVGLFSSPFDAPRLTFVFFSLLFIANHEIIGAKYLNSRG